MIFRDRWLEIIESRIIELEKKLAKSISETSLRNIYVFLNFNKYLLKLFNGENNGKIKRQTKEGN